MRALRRGRDGGRLDEPVPLGPLIALSVLLAIGTLALLAPILLSVLPGVDLAAPLEDQHQDAETLLFLIAFGVLLPLSVIASGRIADRILAGPNRDGFSAAVGALAIGLILALLATKAAERTDLDGGTVLAVAAVLWLVLAAGVLGRAAAPRPWAPLGAGAGRAASVWAVAGLLAPVLVLAFARLGSVSLPVLLVGAAAVAAVVLAGDRPRVPALRGRAGLAADLVVLLLLALAVPNVVGFVAGDPETAFQTSIIQFHQDFFLGPANQVLGGGAMLVDTLSQYGVASIYFLCGLFTFIPIGNGTLGLIEGVLSALMFMAAYGVMRVAGVSRLPAAAAMVVAVVVLVYGLVYPIGGLLQHGAIRFGLPAGVVLGAVMEARWPRLLIPARALQLATLGLASVWALEGFAYSLLTVAAIVVVQAALAPAGGRLRLVVAWVVQVAAACVIAHVVLAGATLAATGELPRWGWYLNTLREFLVGQIGDLTYDFSPWSPGLAVGALYLASGIAATVVVLRRRDAALQERTMVIAIAGTTAFGIALFSYLVNRSADHIVPYVCLPAVTLAALWISLLGRPGLAASAGARRAALGLALGASVLLTAVAWSSVDTRFSQSALAHAVPGGDSLRGALERLWDRPAFGPEAPEGERLLAEHTPGEESSIVLTKADLSIEILLRAGRSSEVPLGDPWEDSFVPDDHLAPLGDFVDSLEPGDRLLIDAGAREAFATYRRDPSLSPFEAQPTGSTPTGLASLQLWVLKEIGADYDLRPVSRGRLGLEVVELVPPGFPLTRADSEQVQRP